MSETAAVPQGKISSNLSLLQAAASQVAEEEQEEGFGGLLVAADEIANERGLSSPLRRSPERSLEHSYDLRDRYGLRDNAGSMTFREGMSLTAELNRKMNAFDAISKDQIEADLDAMELLNQMNFKPKPSATVGFEADVAKLLQMAEDEHIIEPTNENMKQQANATHPAPKGKQKDVNKEKTARITQRYLHKLTLQASQNKSRTSTGSSLHRTSMVSHPSKVSMMLSMADEKPYRDRIRHSFRTEIEEMLFRSMQVVRPDSARSCRSSDSMSVDGRSRTRNQRSSTDRLSVPTSKGPSALDIKFDPTLRHSTYDDAKESTFRPTIHGKKKERKEDYDDDRKEDAKFSFISRQEAEERARREELAFNIGKANYDAIIDKKSCPQCGAKQSYDEVKEKRKFCPNCRVEYINTHTWGKVSGKFFKKCTEYAKKVSRHREEILKEVEEELRTFVVKRVDPKTGKLVEVKVEKHYTITPEEEDEFFHRLEEKEALKKMRLKELEKEVYDDRYPFRPILPKRKDHKDDFDEDDFGGSDDDDDNNNPVKAFLKRYEGDMSYRRDKMPQKYLKIRRKKKVGSDGEEADSSEEDLGDAEKDYKPFRF